MTLAPEPSAPAPAAPGAGGGPAYDSGSIAIAAAGASELSAEDRTLGHGVFTATLLDGLRGAADADRDGRVDAEEVAAFLSSEVPSHAARVGGRQTPAVSRSGATGGIYLSR